MRNVNGLIEGSFLMKFINVLRYAIKFQKLNMNLFRYINN